MIGTSNRCRMASRHTPHHLLRAHTTRTPLHQRELTLLSLLLVILHLHHERHRSPLPAQCAECHRAHLPAAVGPKAKEWLWQARYLVRIHDKSNVVVMAMSTNASFKINQSISHYKGSAAYGYRRSARKHQKNHHSRCPSENFNRFQDPCRGPAEDNSFLFISSWTHFS